MRVLVKTGAKTSVILFLDLLTLQFEKRFQFLVRRDFLFAQHTNLLRFLAQRFRAFKSEEHVAQDRFAHALVRQRGREILGIGVRGEFD